MIEVPFVILFCFVCVDSVVKGHTENETCSSETVVLLLSFLLRNNEIELLRSDFRYANCTFIVRHNESLLERRINTDIFKLWKYFPLNIFNDSPNVSKNCYIDYQNHVKLALNNNLDSLKMFDASAKFPSGLLSGNVNQFGDYDECIQIPNVQYCLALIDLSKFWTDSMLPFKEFIHAHYAITETFHDPSHRIPGSSFVRWAFCIPKSCTSRDLINAVEEQTNTVMKIGKNICQSSGNEANYSRAELLTRFYFVIIFVLVLLSTVMYEKLYIKNSFWKNCLNCFALQRNWTNLTKITLDYQEYRAVHGVRFLSALALFIAHKTMALLYNPYINKTWMAEWIIKCKRAAVRTGTVPNHPRNRTSYKPID